MSRLFVILLLAALTLSACGGGGSSSTAATPPPATGGGTSNSGGAIVDPTLVTTAAGGTVSGVDIIVPSGASTINATVLGVAALTGVGSASSTGDVIHRGATMRVLLFGTGLSSQDTVTISGPVDITITGVQSITSTAGKSGVAFTATVDPNAALGARTVRLHSGNNITTFAGGLEVIP